jgi:SAM-dependent methyltransferase
MQAARPLILHRLYMSSTYPSALYKTIASIDKDHFWFTSRNRMIEACIRSSLPHYAGMRLLEIGCGTGIVLNALERMGFICTGLDVNAQALVYARKRTKGQLIRRSIFGYTTATKYDVIGAFDVLEHIGDDVKFLQICHRLLAPKGYILLTVPAGRWLWSRTDVASGHQRRYEEAELRHKLERAGFRVQKVGYWNALLLPLYALWHRQPGINKKDVVAAHLQRMPQAINTLLEWVFFIELRLSSWIRLPIGATLVVCAQKGGTA